MSVAGAAQNLASAPRRLAAKANRLAGFAHGQAFSMQPKCGFWVRGTRVTRMFHARHLPQQPLRLSSFERQGTRATPSAAKRGRVSNKAPSSISLSPSAQHAPAPRYPAVPAGRHRDANPERCRPHRRQLRPGANVRSTSRLAPRSPGSSAATKSDGVRQSFFQGFALSWPGGRLRDCNEQEFFEQGHVPPRFSHSSAHPAA